MSRNALLILAAMAVSSSAVVLRPCPGTQGKDVTISWVCGECQSLPNEGGQKIWGIARNGSASGWPMEVYTDDKCTKAMEDEGKPVIAMTACGGKDKCLEDDSTYVDTACSDMTCEEGAASTGVSFAVLVAALAVQIFA